jgi:hypothetical protein
VPLRRLRAQAHAKGTHCEAQYRRETALADQGVGKHLADLGLEIFSPDQQTPEVLAALQKAEIDKWWPIIKAAGIKAE